MQAVILAAGRSTRTYPLTSTRPKPLLPIWDRPLLEHQLAQLAGIVDEALLVVGYRKEQIEARFGDEHRGIRLRYINQRAQRGTADAVAAARPFVRERILVLNGDDFYHHQDLRALAEGGRGLLVTQAPDPQNRAVVRIENELIADIVEKPENAPPGSWCSVGGYCVEAADLALLDDLPLSPRGELELPDFIVRLVDASSVRPQRIGQWWLPLTYAWDVLTAIQHIWANAGRAADLGIEQATGSVDDADAIDISGPVWIGDDVRIARGIRIVGPTTIASHATIEPGVTLERVAVFAGAHIGKDARILDSVLGEGVRVGAGAVLDSRPGQELTIDVNRKKVTPELARLGTIVGDGAVVDAGATIPAGTLIPAP
jgi:NDP-sugar pyrophosphorylase family protein